jgi:polysaccharide biosynthesis transport protein
MNAHDHDQALDLEQLLSTLRRRAPLIILCLVLVTGLSFVFSKSQTKKYTATASLIFNNAQISQQVAGLQAVNSSEPKIQQSTNVTLVELGRTAAQTARKLRAGLIAKNVKESLSVNARGESNVVDVSATWTSPTLAARIANTYVNQFVADQIAANHRYFASAQALVQRQLDALSPQQRVAPQGLALQDRAQSLAILSQLQSANAQVAQLASVPASPSSPKVVRNTVVGAILSLFLAIGLVFLLERLDRRVREPQDLERIYGLPLLGVVPESSVLSETSQAAAYGGEPLPTAEAEVFRLMRAHLRYFNVDRDLHTLVVVSATPGDGKTTVARNLAVAAATMGSRTLLMETDLRRPTISQHLGLDGSSGLAAVLIGLLPPSDGQPPSGRSLDVLVAGTPPPPNPAELVESQAMKNLLSELRSEYDLVVIDTPPLTVVSDAFPLLSQVDGVIVVGRMGHNRRDVAARLRGTLKSVDATLLGVVANGLKAGKLDSYSYSSSYYRAQPAGGASANGANGSPDAAHTPTATGPERS